MNSEGLIHVRKDWIPKGFPEQSLHRPQSDYCVLVTEWLLCLSWDQFTAFSVIPGVQRHLCVCVLLLVLLLFMSILRIDTTFKWVHFKRKNLDSSRKDYVLLSSPSSFSLTFYSLSHYPCLLPHAFLLVVLQITLDIHNSLSFDLWQGALVSASVLKPPISWRSFLLIDGHSRLISSIANDISYPVSLQKHVSFIDLSLHSGLV